MKAKRGDLVVIERKNSYVTTSAGWHESTEYEVGIVTSITRDGMVKAVRRWSSESSTPIRNLFGYIRSYVVPQAEIDVQGAAEAAWANPWHQGSPGKPFDSLEEVRAILRPFKAVAA